MNVSMPIAAVMLDLGFPAASLKAVPMLARTAGLLAHLAEERERPIGFLMAAAGRGGDRLPAAGGARLMLDPEVETRPGTEQLALDDAAYRAQLAYLLRALGLLPREARGGRRSRCREASAGWPTSRALPLTEKQELRASGTAANPIGAHLCGDRERDRAHLLHQRHHRHAELHPADRVRS